MERLQTRKEGKVTVRLGFTSLGIPDGQRHLREHEKGEGAHAPGTPHGSPLLGCHPPSSSGSK